MIGERFGLDPVQVLAEADDLHAAVRYAAARFLAAEERRQQKQQQPDDDRGEGR